MAFKQSANAIDSMRELLGSAFPLALLPRPSFLALLAFSTPFQTCGWPVLVTITVVTALGCLRRWALVHRAPAGVSVGPGALLPALALALPTPCTTCEKTSPSNRGRDALLDLTSSFQPKVRCLPQNWTLRFWSK